MEEIINKLKQKARDSWGGKTGEDRAEALEKFLRKTLAQYSEILNLPQEAILKAIESRRTYSAINYYQEANFPDLKGVRLFDTLEDFTKAFPSRKFRCPSCKGISTNPYTCNSGKEMTKGKICDWKSWGLFGTMGKGLWFTIKKSFLEKPFIGEIFMPIEEEHIKEGVVK